MNTSELERELSAARERLQKATRALSGKHKGGEWDEYRIAHSTVQSLERQLAAARGLEYAEPFDFPVAWDTGAPMPHLLVSNSHAFLVFYVHVDDPSWDGSYVKVRNPGSDLPESFAVVEFYGCVSVKFGSPNDEVLHGHSLADSGLEPYSAQIVRNSKWIRELETINKVHPLYKAELWRDLNHYVFWFHDETFECVAESYEVEVLYSRLPEVLQQLTKRLIA